jgi:hypothetical protein
MEDKMRRKPRRQRAADNSKPVDPMAKGLPANEDAERLVLGSVLLNDTAYPQVAAALESGDFSLEKHRRIFARMKDLYDRGEHVDRITVADELIRQGQLESVDGLSYLVSLDQGMPEIPHLDSYIRIVKDKAALRKMIFSAQMTMDECLLETAVPDEILNSHLAQIEELRTACSGDRRQIRRVEDLESIFAKRAPLEYLVKPELPAKAIVCLTGDSESGKTTLACAWTRDVLSRGHAVLILDRDKNPRDRICERLERLGIQSDGEFFHVWDCEQMEEPPQPDNPIVIDWVKRMAEASKSPLVIVDSLVSFFEEDQDENSAVDMRAVFNRCRALTKLGATVIVIHHTNRNGETRGSSDFSPASDQAFLVSNCDRGGGRLLDLITLKCEKSRYGLSGSIRYRYTEGQMLRVADYAPIKTVSEQLVELLKANPGILAQPFEDLANEHRLGRNRARDFLKSGAQNGTIRVKPEGRKRHHFWQGAEATIEDPDPQGSLDSVRFDSRSTLSATASAMDLSATSGGGSADSSRKIPASP